MEFPNFLDPQAVFDFANTQSWIGWLSLGINLILSTIVSGIVLIFLVEIFSHKFGESIKPQNAFLVALIGNILNLLITMFALTFVPLGVYIVPIFLWLLFIKVFFSEMNVFHAFLVATLFFMLNILLIPSIVRMVAAYIPFSTS